MNKKHLRETKNYYDEAFKDPSTRRERGFGWEYIPSRSVVEMLEKHKLLKNRPRVLDVGIGDGRHAGLFLDAGCEVVGVDISANALKVSKKRFKDNPLLELFQVDVTECGSVKKLETFDLILDWSVMDHMRREYLAGYVKNLYQLLNIGGYLLSSQFALPLIGAFKGKDFKIVDGQYYRGYTKDSLLKTLSPLDYVDSKIAALEDTIKGFRFTSVLMQKTL